MKIVINKCFGGFGLSEIGAIEYLNRGGSDRLNASTGYSFDISRTDLTLIRLVEEDSKLYSGSSAELKVVEIPDDVEYEIMEYDGREHIAEVHRKWY